MSGEARELNSPPADCRRFDALLADWPVAESNPWLEQHAGRCPSCRSLFSDIQRIVSASRSLPEPEFNPPSYFWNPIREQLIAEGVIREKGQWLRRWLPVWYRPMPAPGFVGALTVVIVLAGLVAWGPSSGKRDGVSPVSVAEGGITETEVATLPTPVSIAQAQILPAIYEMEKSFREQTAGLPPEATATELMCMTTVDRAIEECQKIVDEEPGNVLAQEQLYEAYEQKMALLSAAIEWNTAYEGR